MVTAIRWMQKFVGRAESTLPFSTLAYLHPTTDFFFSPNGRLLSENQCPGNSETSATESWPCLLLGFLSKVPLWTGLSKCQVLCLHRPCLSC